MKTIHAAFAIPILVLALAGVPSVAQDHADNHAYQQHKDWKAGAKIHDEDWNRGEKIDYQKEHLRRPATGEEWREIDGNYVLAKADGTIITVRRAPADH